MATPSRILAWRIAWTEEPGGLQPTGSGRVRGDGATDALTSLIYEGVSVSGILQRRLG